MFRKVGIEVVVSDFKCVRGKRGGGDEERTTISRWQASRCVSKQWKTTIKK